MAKRKKSNFIVQGSILAITSIIVRIIGLIYRIPLTNILGDQGNNSYAIAFDIYSILLIISSYSLPLAVSKLVSAKVALGQLRNSYRIFLSALMFATVVGIVASIFTYFIAEPITTLWNNPESAIALKILAPTLIIMAIVGVFRGYFQGLGTMVPTAFSNIVEQIANALISVFAAKYLFEYGKTVKKVAEEYDYSAAYGAAGGTLGTSIGALTALLFLIFIFILYKKNIQKQNLRDTTIEKVDYSSIFKLLVLTIAPVILSTCIYNISGFIDSGIFHNIMDAKGMDEDTRKILYGMYSGKYIILKNVPIALASALASSIIPSLVASISIGKKGQVINKVETSIRFSMLITIPCAVGLAVLAGPIMKLLFSDKGIEIPIKMMQIGAVSVIFYSLSTMTNGILQGINKMKIPVKHAFISLLIHIVLMVVFLFATDFNIYVVVVTDMVFALIVTVLNAISLRKYLNYHQEFIKTFLLPMVASLIMGVFAFGGYQLVYMFTKNNPLGTIFAILLSVVVYGVLLFVFKIIEEAEIYHLPMGKLIVKLAKRLYLLK